MFLCLYRYVYIDMFICLYVYMFFDGSRIGWKLIFLKKFNQKFYICLEMLKYMFK